jgi:hypothetical protein
MELPIKAFCLNGFDEKIELTITEILGFPDSTSYEGGYDVKGNLDIEIGSYIVHCTDFYFATGVLYRFLDGLENCYKTLIGKAEYKHLLEHDLEFTLEMTKLGHACVTGTYHENPALDNELRFEMETDQTCIKLVIDEIKNVRSIFGDYTGTKKI